MIFNQPQNTQLNRPQNPFQKAFDLARNHGKESFFFNNKQFNTKLSNEADSTWINYLNARTPQQFLNLPPQPPQYKLTEPLDTVPLNNIQVKKQQKPKFQQGGQVQDQQQQLIQQVAQLIQQGGPEQAVQALVQQGAPQDQAVQIVQQVIQMMQGNPQAARRGAKLTYLKSLLNPCPAGTELTYYKVGGVVCPKCEKACKGKKLEKGGKTRKSCK